MPREYAKITVYRGGTLDNPTDPYVIENDFSTVVVDTTMAISSIFEIQILNFHEEHTDAFFTGNVIEIDIGTVGNHKVVLRGFVFSIEYQEDFILVRGKDWSHFLIGPKVTRRYGNVDYAYVLRDLILFYAPSLKTDFLLDTGKVLTEEYAGGYNTLLNVCNELTGMINHDWQVRTDRQFIVFPDGLQVDFIDGFNEELDDEDPDKWTEISGTWDVQSNKYHGAIASARAITRTSITTSLYQDIRCIMNLDVGDSMFIIYDFQSSSDWKYVMLDEANDNIRIGYWDGSWNHQASSAKTIAEDTDYRVRIVINDKKVTAYTWDVTNEEWDEETDYTFGSMSTGTIGIGAEGTSMVVDFDDFVIYSSGLESIDVDEDCLGWNIAKRDFRDLVNRVTIIGGKERLTDEFISTLWQWGTQYGTGDGTISIIDEELDMNVTTAGSYELRQWTEGKYKNNIFEAKVKAVTKSNGWQHQPCLLIRGQDDSNLYRLRINADDNKLQFYKIISDTPTLLKEISYTFDPDTWYTIKIKATEHNFKVYIDDENKMDFEDTTYSVGFNGLATEDGHSRFDDVEIITDRDVIASASDATLIEKWGEKSTDPIRDDAIYSKSAALKRAQNELNLHRYEKTRGLLKLEGNVDIVIGDVIELTAKDCAIDAENYRIISAIHMIDDDEGYVTMLKVAEYFPGLEAVIRMISSQISFLDWIGILKRTLIKSVVDTIPSITDTPTKTLIPYYCFYFDEEDTWGYSYIDFCTFN